MTSSTHSSPTPLDCTAVDARLADYLDDESPSALTDADRSAVDRHVASCARCRALVRDLRGVTAAAAALPALAPSRDLWADIAPRLAPRAPAAAAPTAADTTADDTPARVLPFEVRHLRHAPPAPGRRASAPVAWSRPWLAAAAVALMAVSAGTTYLFTRGGAAPDAAATHVAAGPAGAPATPAIDAAASGDAPRPADEPGAVAGGAPAGAMPVDVAAATPAPRGRGAQSAARPAGRLVAGASDLDLAAVVPVAAAYDREIAALRAVVRERGTELDSATVNVLVRNLGIIDAAIAQSRTALARDPHSQFLGDQLTRALGQKVELLRTVALMPRT